MKKPHTTIRINDFIKAKLREQADKIGMDVSNYIAYLVMYKEEQDKQIVERRDRQIVNIADQDGRDWLRVQAKPGCRRRPATCYNYKKVW